MFAAKIMHRVKMADSHDFVKTSIMSMASRPTCSKRGGESRLELTTTLRMEVAVVVLKRQGSHHNTEPDCAFGQAIRLYCEKDYKDREAGSKRDGERVLFPLEPTTSRQ